MKETKYLDSEEQELIESLESDSWRSAGDVENWKALLSKTAVNTLARDVRPMKTIFCSLTLSVCVLFSSCNLFNITPDHYYYKCFFLGETGFLIEGETFNIIPDASIWKRGKWHYPEPPLAENIPFDSLVARISEKPGTSDYYTDWEIPAVKITESKFQLQVDITANGITINKDIVTKNNFRPLLLFFPKYTNSSGSLGDFPAFELQFFFNGRQYSNSRPVFQEEVENNVYGLYMYTYMYVAEPIDMSETYETGINPKETRHKALNFSKPGWYKIIERYYREIDDDPTGKSTYFIPPEREVASQ